MTLQRPVLALLIGLAPLVPACSQDAADAPAQSKQAARAAGTEGGNPDPAAAGRSSGSDPVPATTPATTSSASWPRFHGPRGDNISDDTGLLNAWPEDGPELLWKVEGIGNGFASVTVSDGRIFTAGNVGDQLLISALDMDGKILWQRPNGPGWTKSYPGARGTPTLDGDRVYHLGAAGDLACLKAADGAPVWSTNILEKFGSQPPEWGLAESVLIDGDRVICTPGGPNTCIVALDKMTGETVWQSESAGGDGPSYGTPQLAEWEGLRIVLGMTAKALVGVDADSGKLLFRHPRETQYDVNACLPIFRDGKVFISTGYGSGAELIGLKKEGGRVTAQQIWENKDLDNHHGGVILYEGFLYGSNFRGKWVCLDWNTGETKYTQNGVGKGSATLADGMLYTFSERKKVGLAPAVPTAHELTGSFTIPSQEREQSWAHPVVLDGRLYLRHGNLLFAYGVRGK
ncbi:MAG: PQQ-binding-like beta-propeller repeat protein [Thermogutta sp.]|nr:PQQ-binding-like beta-propeller repeat protein [Thermogutta sp.]